MTKTVLVTGGGRGLGRVAAEKLAFVGHRVILVARTPAAAAAAVAEIQQRHPHVRLEARSVDLSLLAHVPAFATTEAERGEPIDVLFHIGGVMQTSKAVGSRLTDTKRPWRCLCSHLSCSPPCCSRRWHARSRRGSSRSVLGYICPGRAVSRSTSTSTIRS